MVLLFYYKCDQILFLLKKLFIPICHRNLLYIYNHLHLSENRSRVNSTRDTDTLQQQVNRVQYFLLHSKENLFKYIIISSRTFKHDFETYNISSNLKLFLRNIIVFINSEQFVFLKKKWKVLHYGFDMVYVFMTIHRYMKPSRIEIVFSIQFSFLMGKVQVLLI